MSSVNSWEYPRPFQGVHEVKTIFIIMSRLFAFSYCVDICTDDAKAMVGALRAPGARIQEVVARIVVFFLKVNFLEK